MFAVTRLLLTLWVPAFARPGDVTHLGRPFGLLLCDYRLADGVDGLDAGLRLSQGPGEGRAEIPLLLITGETSPARLQRVRESQVPVLFKPVVAAALLQAMAELTAAKPAAEPSLIDV